MIAPGKEVKRVTLPEYTDQIWHGYLSEVSAGRRFTAFGYTARMNLENGHRFNPNKLLLDPYACAHVGYLKWDPAVFGYKMESADDLTFDERDSAPFMPKSTVVDPSFDWTGSKSARPRPLERYCHL